MTVPFTRSGVKHELKFKAVPESIARELTNHCEYALLGARFETEFGNAIQGIVNDHALESVDVEATEVFGDARREIESLAPRHSLLHDSSQRAVAQWLTFGGTYSAHVKHLPSNYG